MGTDPTALGGNARGDVMQFRDTFLPAMSMFQPNYPLVPTDRERVRAWAYPTSYNTNYTRGHPARPATRWPVHRNIPDLVRIVVAIDPAVSTGEDADETGIIVAGKDADGHGYVLADQSARYAPTEWAARKHTRYREHRVSPPRRRADSHIFGHRGSSGEPGEL